MGIYIKGMEMPMSCIDCPLYRYTATSHYCCVAAIRGQKATERHKDCPLVEIKTPHGRLIDAEDMSVNRYDNNVDEVKTIIEGEDE